MLDGVYIHIPFCMSICNYCDFLSFLSKKEERKKYTDYLVKELELYPKYEYDTVYFGGGTPSIMDSEDIEKVLDRLDIKDNTEVTLEVNPKTVDLIKLQELKKAGINRLSIGIQTFDDEMLKTLGRKHSSQEGIETYLQARKAGFENISLDLMFSLPNQSFEAVKKDLEKILELRPEHFSIYSLIWEEGTPFFKKLEEGVYQETDNELEAQMFEYIIDRATEAGYIHYEISNFCLPGKEARHNSKYWENKEYLGVGLGASGYIDGKRYKNQVQFSKYYDNIDRGVFPIFEEEIVDLESKEEYRYMLGLRLLKKGVIPSEKYLEKCISLEKRGLLQKIGESYILTRKGILLANDVIDELI